METEHPFLSAAGQRTRWGDAVDPGLVIVPSGLLRHQHRLGLEMVDMIVIMNIVEHWDPDGAWPAARPTIIAKRMGRDRRTVERSICKLIAQGLLRRVRAGKGTSGPSGTRIDLTGLLERLKAFSRQEPGPALRRRSRAS